MTQTRSSTGDFVAVNGTDLSKKLAESLLSSRTYNVYVYSKDVHGHALICLKYNYFDGDPVMDNCGIICIENPRLLDDMVELVELHRSTDTPADDIGRYIRPKKPYNSKPVSRLAEMFLTEPVKNTPMADKLPFTVEKVVSRKAKPLAEVEINESELIIEDNVPLPSKAPKKIQEKRSIIWQLKEPEPTGKTYSIFFAGLSPQAVNGMTKVMRKEGWTFSIRKAEKDGIEGARIWRKENKLNDAK